ncbi:hypothetical protein ACFVFQ_31625 [Streptomyces sp. NPDC057743]|uniref:hypothetical protein n=1 Tax=Streptomyces sp. NPDC057743 TaxID=3346236 RepID=UPI00369B3BC2
MASSKGTNHEALAGLSFAPDGPVADRREGVHDRLRNLGLAPTPISIGGLGVALTDRCNMACAYCYRQFASFGFTRFVNDTGFSAG